MTVTLYLTVEEVDFIINVLGSVPTLQTVQANKLALIPKIRDQAQASLLDQQRPARIEIEQLKMRETGFDIAQNAVAQENIQKQLDLRSKLDAIEKEPERQTGVHFRG